MTRFRLSLSIGAAAFGLLLAAPPAQALNLVSYVSFLTGNDGNSCSAAGPCATIFGTLLKTEPGGEIKCLDNHVDDIITIEKPITLDCGAPGALIGGSSGNPAITVNLNEGTYPNGVVTLRNLNLDGFLGNGPSFPAPTASASSAAARRCTWRTQRSRASPSRESTSRQARASTSSSATRSSATTPTVASLCIRPRRRLRCADR
jgi:hypothetical protein